MDNGEKGGIIMNIREYRYILEIARQGGISKAAAVLHISQPSLSAYLKNLENRLGTQLFYFSSGKVYPTPAGSVYLEYARQIVGLDDNMMETLDGFQHRRSGVIRLGITGGRSVYLTPNLLTACTREHPGIELRIQEHNSSALVDLICNQRRLEIILINGLPRSSGLVHQVLFQEQILLAVPTSIAHTLKPEIQPDHALPWIDLRQLAEVPFVLMRPGHRLRQMTEQLFTESAISPPILLETLYPSTAISLTKAGLAACLLYDSFLFEHHCPEVTFFRVGANPLFLSFVAAYFQESLAFPPVQAVLDCTIRTAKETYNIFRKKANFPNMEL